MCLDPENHQSIIAFVRSDLTASEIKQRYSQLGRILTNQVLRKREPMEEAQGKRALEFPKERFIGWGICVAQLLM